MTTEGVRPEAIRRLLAELLVIVAGVLIALWVDEWRQDREDRAKEGIYLASVRNEFQENRRRLDLQLVAYERRREAQGKLVELGPALSGLPQDSVVTLWAWALRGGNLNPALGATEALISSGGLSLVRDPELRSLVATVQAELEDFAEVEAIYTDFLDHQLLPRMRARVAIPPRFGENSKGEPLPPFDYGVLLEDPIFLGMLREQMGYVRVLRGVSTNIYAILDQADSAFARELGPR